MSNFIQQGYLVERLKFNRHSGSFMIDMEILISIMKSPSHTILNDILTLDQLCTVTSIPIRIFTNFITLIPSLTFTELRVVLQRVWHASREPDTWFRPFWNLVKIDPVAETSFPELVLFSIFHLDYQSLLSRFCFSHRWIILAIAKSDFSDGFKLHCGYKYIYKTLND